MPKYQDNQHSKDCKCENCSAALKVGELIHKSKDGLFFCSLDCALDYYEITLDFLEKGDI